MLNGLIVDGDKTAGNRLTNLLRESVLSIEVNNAVTISEACQYLKNRYFYLVFMELNFPDGNGIELIKSIALQSPRTNCVVMTTAFDSQNIFSALHAGAYGYLLKNQSDGELIQTLNGILNGAPPLSTMITRRLVYHFHNFYAELKNTGLTNKEKEVLTLIAKGISRSDTANLLNITDNTAASYIKNIYRKLEISSRAEATQEAIRFGLVQTYSL